MEYTDYDLGKLACEKLLGIGFSKRPYEGRVDPINDWGVLGPLMVKYKVNVFQSANVILIASELSGKLPVARIDYKSESEIPRAIIMCILKSKNII